MGGFNHMHDITSLDMSNLASAFGHCEKHGKWHRETYAWLIVNGKSDWCKACMDENKKEKDDQDNKAKRIAAEARRIEELERNGVGKRFIGKTFDTFVAENQEQQRALESCRAVAESVTSGNNRTPSLILCGAPGTGKTHLACAMVQYCLEYGKSVRKANVMQIVRNIKSTWSKDSEHVEEDVISFYSERDLLVIDEIGVQFGSDTERMYIFDIINRRYDAVLPTVLISNLDIDALRVEIGERVIDRLREDSGKLLLFTGVSWRKH